MRVYLYTPATNRLDLSSFHGRIKRLLRQAGAAVTTNTERTADGLSAAELEAIEAAGGIALDTMDAVVIEATESDSRVGYLLAYAVARQKPTLFLYHKRSGQPELLTLLDKRAAPKTLVIKGFLSDNLDEVLQNFLRGFKELEVTEQPTVKFTLRLTKTMEKYLSYKTHNTETTKADWLRDEIDAKMKKDEAFWKWLKRQAE